MFDYIPLEDVKVNLKEGKLYFTAIIPEGWVKAIKENTKQGIKCNIPISIGETPQGMLMKMVAVTHSFKAYDIKVIEDV